jgi:thioredoxin-related protein
MLKIFICLLLSLICLQGISFPQDMVADIVELAKFEDKKTIVLFSGKYCSWCNKLNDLMNKDDDVKNILSSYIVLHFDIEKDVDMAKKYKVRTVPAVFILDERGEIEKSVVGYKGKEKFIDFLSE